MKRALFLIFFFITACSASLDTVTITSSSGDHTVHVERVTTLEDQAKGLMYRESLGANEGMLFVFPDEQIRTFWMKNTLIPLDIIFIDADGNIMNIAEALPCEEDPCERYVSTASVQYVLEVNKGYSKEKGIKPGDHLTSLS